jgi:hypothetical protein
VAAYHGTCQHASPHQNQHSGRSVCGTTHIMSISSNNCSHQSTLSSLACQHTASFIPREWLDYALEGRDDITPPTLVVSCQPAEVAPSPNLK